MQLGMTLTQAFTKSEHYALLLDMTRKSIENQVAEERCSLPRPTLSRGFGGGFASLRIPLMLNVPRQRARPMKRPAMVNFKQIAIIYRQTDIAMFGANSLTLHNARA